MASALIVHRPMPEAFVDFERALLEQLAGEQRRVRDRHDLIVVSMHDERRHVDALQVFGEIGSIAR